MRFDFLMLEMQFLILEIHLALISFTGSEKTGFTDDGRMMDDGLVVTTIHVHVALLCSSTKHG